jgi:DNA-directed RNA polymerase subunit delta
MDISKSMLEVAYETVAKSKKAMSFADIYAAVASTLKMTDEEKKAHLGAFYTELTLDGRFVALTDNAWDLRSRHTYDKVHIDVNDVYSDVEEEGEDEEDKEEEQEYNAIVEGKTIPEEPTEETADVDGLSDEDKTVDVDVDALVSK